jgi:hypothetical protein
MDCIVVNYHLRKGWPIRPWFFLIRRVESRQETLHRFDQQRDESSLPPEGYLRISQLAHSIPAAVGEHSFGRLKPNAL